MVIGIRKRYMFCNIYPNIYLLRTSCQKFSNKRDKVFRVYVRVHVRGKRIRSDALRAIMPSIGQAAGLCIP